MRTVLLVEDEDALREGMAALLTARGYRTLQAGDGTDALATLAYADVDIIVLDLGLPTLDGRAVLKILRSHSRGIPVVIVSCEEPPPKSLPPVVAFLQKPITASRLIGEVRRWTEVQKTGPAGDRGAGTHRRELAPDEAR